MLPILDFDIPWEGVDDDGSSFLGILLQVVIIVYCFLGLALVCDEHMVVSLDTLCQRWGIGEDVAGATFMAFGSAAPEMIINVIATIQSQTNDPATTSLGVSAILGSGMIAFSLIPAACGLAASKTLVLKRRPLFRDQFFYMTSLICLIIIIFQGRATVFMCVVLVINYVIYLNVIVFATKVRKFYYENWLGLNWEDRHMHDAEEQPLLPEGGPEAVQLDETTAREEESMANLFAAMSSDSGGDTPNVGDAQVHDAPRQMSWHESLSANDLEELIPVFQGNKQTNPELWYKLTKADFKDMGVSKGAMKKFARFMSKPEFQRGSSVLVLQDLTDSDSDSEHEAHGPVGKIIHFMCVPLEFLFGFTCPDCEIGAPKENLYLLTFFASFLWVTVFSFVLSSIIERWVNISGVPMTFFGLVLVSLGAEIPDTIESVTVAKRGYGSMAIANCQGTQVINICLGLGLPWLITLSTGSKITLMSRELIPPALIQCCLLCVNIGSLLGITLLMRWPKSYLSKKKSYILIATYCVAIATFGIYLAVTGEL